ncbi:TetR/AcrR family transcriptional regulator [Burkholderia gladioli]|uniref:TetR/AcrR family transcriptional regulator n=1 Tax=Burkholderia gladioli TaxID=28095 RepID=UPI00163EADBD|nr:TetR/AcrR family transcriptional regulator [Burkholderia gladioli]
MSRKAVAVLASPAAHGAPARRRRSPEERRVQIIRESIAFFSEHGFGGSTHELAKRIGVTQPLMFRYFASKDALIDAVFDAVFMQRWDSRWPKLLTDRAMPVRARLVAFYRAYLGAVFNREWMRLYVFAGLSGVEINRRYFQLLERRLLVPLCTELRHAFDLAPVDQLPVTADELDFVWSFHGGIFYHGIRRCAFETSTDHEMSDAVLNATIDAFLAAAPRVMAGFVAAEREKG